MGATGAGLFSDDMALDVREAYVDFLRDGLTGPQASKQMLMNFREEIKDRDDGPIFWLALADTQWKYGRLDARVRDKALRLIDSGLALRRWAERAERPALVRKREEVHDQLARKLRSPQPPAKKVRPSPRNFEDPFAWPAGEVFAYRLESGKYVLIHIVDCQGPPQYEGYHPFIAVLKWCGRRLPPAERIQRLPYCDEESHFGGKSVCIYAISRRHDREPDPERLRWLGIKRPIAPKSFPGVYFKDGHINGGYKFANWGQERGSEGCFIDERPKEIGGWS